MPVTDTAISFTLEGDRKPAMTIEIHNPELESILDQRLKTGNFASIDMLGVKAFGEVIDH